MIVSYGKNGNKDASFPIEMGNFNAFEEYLK